MIESILGYDTMDPRNTPPELIDVLNALQAAGIDGSDSISMHSAIERCYFLLGREVSQCERLLAGNVAPISAIVMSALTKLIVTIDETGCCCVWDPIGSRANLAVSDPYNRPALVGSWAYSLVSRTNLQSVVAKVPQLLGEASPDTLNIKVSSVETLSLKDNYATTFPVDNQALMKAYTMDSKFEAADVTVRGFIYVMKDLTNRFVETSAFLPQYITLDNPFQFMYTQRLLHDLDALSSLQDLYRQKNDVYRVVYAVSCSHSAMDKLADDLNQYGVLQRGYNTTPSATRGHVLRET
jgi:hypothetical protein